MIKIFSIKEIIDASESILSNFEKKKEKTKIFNKKVQTNDEPLVLNSEVKPNKSDYYNQHKNNQVHKKTEENDSKNLRIIDELYKLFEKKIKKIP